MAGNVLDLHRGCVRAREWVSLRIDGELSELERLLLRRHLSRCEGCRAFAEAARSAADVLRSTPAEAPSRALAPAQPVVRRRRLRYRLAAAGVVIAVGAGVGGLIAVTGGDGGSPTPKPGVDIAQRPPGPPGGTVTEPPPGQDV